MFQWNCHHQTVWLLAVHNRDLEAYFDFKLNVWTSCCADTYPCVFQSITVVFLVYLCHSVFKWETKFHTHKKTSFFLNFYIADGIIRDCGMNGSKDSSEINFLLIWNAVLVFQFHLQLFELVTRLQDLSSVFILWWSVVFIEDTNMHLICTAVSHKLCYLCVIELLLWYFCFHTVTCYPSCFSWTF
jgi:hypothetical protein